MKTLTITSDDRFMRGLTHIANHLERAMCNEPSVGISFKSQSDRVCLEVKIADQTVERRVFATLQTQLAKLIISDAKSHYIQSNMRLVIPDEVNRHAFIRALSSFDKETDFLIAKSLIVLTPHFALDSFYDFRITPLKKRWQEVCHLANDNQAYLICPRTFCELLRFLISNLDPLCEEAHITGDKIMLKNQYIPLEASAMPQDAKVVTRLIDLAPRKIVVHRDCNAALTSKIQTLFGKQKVVFK